MRNPKLSLASTSKARLAFLRNTSNISTIKGAIANFGSNVSASFFFGPHPTLHPPNDPPTTTHIHPSIEGLIDPSPLLIHPTPSQGRRRLKDLVKANLDVATTLFGEPYPVQASGETDAEYKARVTDFGTRAGPFFLALGLKRSMTKVCACVSICICVHPYAQTGVCVCCVTHPQPI